MALDITKTGPQSYRQLQQQNQQEFNPETATAEDWYKHLKQRDYNSYSAQPTEYVGVQAAEAGYGNSQFDEAVTSASQLQDLGDIRYSEQPWYDTLANGVGKMLGTAGTTFVSSLVGLPYGLVQAANQGRWSALWDNDVTKGLSDVDKWLEENMTNYRSQVQQNSPWYDPENLFSMNFIADDVIKNMGFTLGAAASMAVGSGSLGLMSRALGFVNDVSKGTKIANNVMSALFSATGEGMIEARQGVEERNKLETQRLEDALTPEYNALEMQKQEIDNQYALTGDYDTYRSQMADYQAQKQNLDNKRAAGLQQIQESGLEMGNKILLANQGLLTMGNLIQFSKGMVKSFDSARHAAEVSSKSVKPFRVSAAKTAEGTYEITGKKLGKTIAATKGILTEGYEEMNQQMIQSSSGAAYNEQDVNDYWKAKLDPESYRETTKGLYTMGQILDRGFNESWGDVNQWEQFVIGGLTGMAGSYTPTKLFNQDKTKSRLDPRRYGSWEGGAYNAVRDFNREYQQYEENIDDLNKILQSEDFPARVKSMTGHTYNETLKTDAAEADDKKAWKDADDKQFIHDVQTFLRAGKLDDLRAIYNELGSQYSDEDIENIIKTTTKEISAEEDKQNHDRAMDDQISAKQREVDSLYDELENLQNGLLGSSPDAYAVNADYVNEQSRGLLQRINEGEQEIADMQQQKQDYVGQKYYEGAYVDRQGNQTITDDQIKEIIKHNSEELNRKLDSYLDSIDYINRRTNGVLTKDQEDNLAYLHNMGKESNVRMQKIMAGVRKQLPNKFLLKTTKTPEQLTQEYASSDLSFNKDENTKEGYVEVDTSLMNDTAFADFFQREVMRGGNIRPEFAETADERAAREEEEKNLPEEEKKQRARERASKKWQSAIQKMQNDADEQWSINWEMLVDNFMENYRKEGNATLDETVEAFGKVRQDLQDASNLFDQAGEFQRTLQEYMANPSLVDRDREKEEAKAQKEEDTQQAKNKFAGKDAKQIKQELADGTLDLDEFEDFAGANLDDVTDDDVKAAQTEVKKAQESMQKASAIKNHIQEQLGDNPTQQELNAAQAAMQMVDDAMMNAEDPSDISIDMPELSQVPLDSIDPNASIEDVDNLNYQVQEMLADAFNAMQEDQQAQDDIPEEVPSVDGVDAPETGHDATTKTQPEVVAPTVSSPSEAAQNPVPKNPLTEGAIGNIISATSEAVKPNTTGTWRSTTTRHPYGKSTGTYHDTLPDKNSKEYKRSKAIWDYLNELGAFNRQENADNDRIKPGDNVHFMVRYLNEVFDEDLEKLSNEDKPYALVIIMLNDNGEPIGDLPLAELEPSYRDGNPTQQVKDLKALQDKVFNAFLNNYQKNHDNNAIVDGVLHIAGTENLNLTFDNPRKSPLMSRVKQVMRGAVPYRYGETNTLNEVVQGTPELAVKVTGTNVAMKRGDRTAHKDVVIPSIGSTGQPYLLLPTASGEKIAVPFYMPQFDAEQHRNTEFYKILSNAIYDLITSNSLPESNKKKAFKKSIDTIQGLLQIEPQEKTRVLEVKGDSVSLHFQSITDPESKIDIKVPAVGTEAEIARSLVSALSGIPINVSLQYLNDSIEAGGRKANYNQVIGEIANVNLPKATRHTVNSWFTVELTTQTGTKPSKKVAPKNSGAVKAERLAVTRRDFVQEIRDAKTVKELIAIEKAAQEAQSKGTITADDLIKISGYVNQKRLSMAEETPDVSDVSASASGAVSLVEPKITSQPKSHERLFDYSKIVDTRNDRTLEKNWVKDGSTVVVYAGSNDIEALIKNGFDPNKNGSGLGNTKGEAKGTIFLTPHLIYAADYGNLYYANGVPADKIGLVKVTMKRGYGTIEGLEIRLPKHDLSAIVSVEKVDDSAFRTTPIAHLNKTLEQIEEEAKQKKIVGRQTKDAWAAIPNDLKMKLMNDGATLQLAYYTSSDSGRVFTNKVVTISTSNRPMLIKALTDANMAAKAGNLRVEEVAKPMEKEGIALTRENEQKARKWLAKNLPSLSSEERTQFVEKITRMGDDAGKYWGSYRSGVIEIQKNAPMGTVYHEAFHYVLDMVLDPEERKQVIEIAKQEYGLSDGWAAEERLANDFRRYAMDENAEGIVGRIKRWLRKIMDKMTRYNRISDATVNQLFWKINNGELAGQSEIMESFEDNQQEILREIRNIQKENIAWKNLSSSTKSALKDSGLSEEDYNKMSLEEKEQYVRCRG